MRSAGTVEQVGQVVDRQSGMVLDLPHLAAGRQDMGEVALPLCRVRLLPEAAHCRGVENRLDATPHPARRFGLLGPVVGYEGATVEDRKPENTATSGLRGHSETIKNGGMADGVGFEPTRGLRPCRFSRPVP